MPPGRIGCGAYGASVTGPGLGTPMGAGSGGRAGVCASATLVAMASTRRIAARIAVAEEEVGMGAQGAQGQTPGLTRGLTRSARGRTEAARLALVGVRQ